MKTQITYRELDVLRKAADGLDEHTIAVSLMLDRREVQNCKKNLLKRLGANTPIDAILAIAKNGFTVSG